MILLLFLLGADHVVVRPGQTLEQIAQQEGVAEQRLRELNTLAPGQEPAAGTVLYLPGQAQPNEAVLTSYFGEGSVEIPGQPTLPLSAPLRLPEGSRVCTGERSHAALRLAGAGRSPHDDVNLLPQSCVVMESLSSLGGAPSSVLSLGRGSLTLLSGDRGASGPITVRTPDAVARADGGGQRLHVEASGTRAESVDGSLSLYGGGQEQQVPAGYGSFVAPNTAPSAPVPLLVAGPTLSPGAQELLRVARFTWTGVDRALGYQVEIALDPRFSEVVVIESAPLPEWTPELLLLPWRAEGMWWRVTPYDRAGYLGIPSPGVPLRFPPGTQP